jgi:hypothetical protein
MGKEVGLGISSPSIKLGSPDKKAMVRLRD